MRRTIEIAMVALFGAGAWPAEAQETAPASDVENVPSGRVLAPKNAVEIGVNGGYIQPFGTINNTLNINDVAQAGGGVGLNVAYRFNPLFALGGYTQFHESVADSSLGSDGSVRGLAAGVLTAFHMLPYNVIDPFVDLGTGYRFMWVNSSIGDNHLFHGFESLKADVGIDFRASKDIALGPMLGADVNVFVWDRAE
jgi:hypothetical protein